MTANEVAEQVGVLVDEGPEEASFLCPLCGECLLRSHNTMLDHFKLDTVQFLRSRKDAHDLERGLCPRRREWDMKDQLSGLGRVMPGVAVIVDEFDQTARFRCSSCGEELRPPLLFLDLRDFSPTERDDFLDEVCAFTITRRRFHEASCPRNQEWRDSNKYVGDYGIRVRSSEAVSGGTLYTISSNGEKMAVGKVENFVLSEEKPGKAEIAFKRTGIRIIQVGRRQ